MTWMQFRQFTIAKMIANMNAVGPWCLQASKASQHSTAQHGLGAPPGVVGVVQVAPLDTAQEAGQLDFIQAEAADQARDLHEVEGEH